MTFLNPLLLAGTALVAIPIVLHLVMRRKPRHFEFPAMRFVQKRHDASRRRLHLRHLVLLALRVLAILLLAAALARPSVRFAGALGSQEAPVAAALVFDTSKRMEYQHENRSRLDEARELGLWLLAQLPRESQIAVLGTGSGPAAFQVDRGAAKHRIERLAARANSRPLTAIVGEAAELVGGSELGRREIYVFTDRARVAWPRGSATRLQDRLARIGDVGLYLVDVGVDEPRNTALGDLVLSDQVLSSRSGLRIKTEVFHTGPAAERPVEVYRLNPNPGKADAGAATPERCGQQIVQLEADQAREIEFDVGEMDVGTHQGYVEIVGTDGLACDDRRFFTVEVKPAWRALIAAPKPPERFSLYLKEMLAPASYVRTGQAKFDCEVISLDELAGHDLEPHSAVFLVDPTPIEPATWERLGEFVADGHGLAVFLGSKAASVESFNAPEAQALLPGKLLRQARRPNGELHLAPRDFEHPVLAAFREHADSIPWQAVPVLRYWQLDKLSPGVGVIVPYNDGQPAILERPVGKGRVLTMTTPISDAPSDRNAWNLLLAPGSASWPTLMLADGMASYLVGAGEPQRNYYAGQTAVLRLDPARSFRSYTLLAPGAPEGADVRLTPNTGERVLVITNTDSLGNYQVLGGGRGSGLADGFSVNLAADQTRLDRLSEEELADVLGPVPHRVARDRNQLETDRSMHRVGRELFAVIILLVAAALAVEQVLANRFYRD